MKSIRIFALPFIVLLLLTGCTITHEYGPYSGKVVDAETNEPIAGAVVLLRFSTEGYSVAGFMGKYADALEVMTDSSGEFKIPAHRVVTFRILHRWDPYGYVKIFKPGYGFYPDHKAVSPMFTPNGTIPSNKHVTIKIPNLKTIEERSDNLNNTHVPGVPDEKKRNLLRLINTERVNVGLSPYPADRYGGDEDER